MVTDKKKEVEKAKKKVIAKKPIKVASLLDRPVVVRPGTSTIGTRGRSVS